MTIPLSLRFYHKLFGRWRTTSQGGSYRGYGSIKKAIRCLGDIWRHGGENQGFVAKGAYQIANSVESIDVPDADVHS